MQTPIPAFKSDFNEEGGFDLKKLFATLRNYWYLFVCSIIASVGIAFLVAMSISPSYEINSKITVDDPNASTMSRASSGGMMDFSDLLGTPNNAYNEMDILRTRNLMNQVVRELHLNITLLKKEKLKYQETFLDAPVSIRTIGKSDFENGYAFDMEINEKSVHVKSYYPMFEKKDGDFSIDTTVDYGLPIPLRGFQLIIDKNEGLFEPGDFRLGLQSVDSRAIGLVRGLAIELTDKKSTTMSLTFEYPNPDKGEAILQTLMKVYLRYNVLNKQEIADSTLSFIDNRLQIVSSELSGVENEFTAFKRRNSIADVDEQSKALIGNVSASKSKQDELEIQLSVLDSISNQINSPQAKQIVPSSLGVADPVFALAIASYDQLLIQRQQLALSYKESNPIIKNLDEEIEAAHQSLLKSFATYRNGLLISLGTLKGKNTELHDIINKVPQKERVFLDYARQQNLKQELYLYLLQKREETAISRTSTIPTARIIDSARSGNRPIKPKKPLILLLGFAVGFVLPTGFLYFGKLLNNKIVGKDDVQEHTSVPIIGEIGNSIEKLPLSIDKHSRSMLLEEFRALRTNLQFVLNNDKSNVILVTSSMSSEGKTFLTVNLANVIAFSGKKVIMLELDLRRPALGESLGVKHDFGFTNYIISGNVNAADVIKPVSFSENVWILPSGPIPPNPTEMLMSDRFTYLIDQLKKQFDYILIDSAPVGLVSDAQLIEKFADVSIYVVRQNKTLKSQLDILNSLIADHKFRKAYVVINDIKKSKRTYYGYGYGANYGEYFKKTKK
jgi:tyrosine-protein kinase Etk/Wzc